MPGTSSTPFSQPAPIPAAQTQLKKPEPKKPTFDAQKILTDRQLKFIRGMYSQVKLFYMFSSNLSLHIM